MPDWFPNDLAELAGFVPLRIAFLVVMAIVARWVLHRLIDRAVRQSITRPLRSVRVVEAASGLSAERREQRISALGSLGRSAVTLVIGLVTVIMVLSELGFNVTTIVAGTSVVAATIGFGMQSLIKDVLSGVSMLVEDQLGVGDYVDMEMASGIVEEIGMRTTQLRAEDGTVWYVRNGEVLRVGNYSKGGPGRPPEPTPAT